MRNNTGNKGGAMRGLDRAAAMSGRDMSGKGKPAATPTPMKKGGKVKKYMNGGVSGAATAGRVMPTAGRVMPTAGAPGMTGLDRAAAMSGREMPVTGRPMKKGGKVKKYAKGGGCEVRGKTKGKMI